MHWFEEKIILASQSPRRRELLQMAGFQIEVRPISVDERFPAGLPVEEVAAYIAEIKAQAAQGLAGPDEILLTADSVVALDGEVYGKPEDYADGVRILRALSGRKHQVYTGVCLQKAGKKRTFTGVSHVYFSELNEEEIDYYLREYKPYDKAGAYAIQEWIGLCKVIKIEGSYSNIVGLPMELVYKELCALTAAER
jgi:septum formation protein